jgi:hypothetical protein
VSGVPHWRSVLGPSTVAIKNVLFVQAAIMLVGCSVLVNNYFAVAAPLVLLLLLLSLSSPVVVVVVVAHLWMIGAAC